MTLMPVSSTALNAVFAVDQFHQAQGQLIALQLLGCPEFWLRCTGVCFLQLSEALLCVEIAYCFIIVSPKEAGHLRVACWADMACSCSSCSKCH